MVTIRDFEKGQTAYCLRKRRTQSSGESIIECKIASVGRKYVTDDHGRRFENWESDYLLENAGYGESALLFLTEQQAKDFAEKEKLVLWLSCLSYNSFSHYSVEQLRAVSHILNGPSNP